MHKLVSQLVDRFIILFVEGSYEDVFWITLNWTRLVSVSVLELLRPPRVRVEGGVWCADVQYVTCSICAGVRSRKDEPFMIELRSVFSLKVDMMSWVIALVVWYCSVE